MSIPPEQPPSGPEQDPFAPRHPQDFQGLNFGSGPAFQQPPGLSVPPPRPPPTPSGPPLSRDEQRQQAQNRYLEELSTTYGPNRPQSYSAYTSGQRLNVPSATVPPPTQPTFTPESEPPIPFNPSAFSLVTAAVEKPPKYKGKRENDACDSWLHRVDLYIFQTERVQGRVYNNEEKIVLTVQLLDGDAWQWYDLKHRLDMNAFRNDGRKEHIRWCYEDFMLFKKLLATRFADTRTQESRWNDFIKLRQVGTVFQYKEKLLIAAQHLDPPPQDHELLRKFKADMSASVRERIEFLPDDSLPDTFDAYVQYADKVERHLYQTTQKSGGSKKPWTPRYGGGGSYTPKLKAATKVDQDGDTEMTLFAIEARHEREKTEWTQKCRDHNLCFKCGKGGHKSFECSVPNVPSRLKQPRKGLKKERKEGKVPRR
jgi:hypothetical protein